MFSLPRRTPAGLLAAEQRLGLGMASGNGHEKPAALVEADAVVIDGLTSLGYSATEAKRAVQYLPDDVPDIEDRLRLAIASFAGTPYTVQPVDEAVGMPTNEAVGEAVDAGMGTFAASAPQVNQINQVNQLIPRGRAPTPAQADLMRKLYYRDRKPYSMNMLCGKFYSYKDDVVLEHVRTALGLEKGEARR
jgi:hypothetical protein